MLYFFCISQQNAFMVNFSGHLFDTDRGEALVCLCPQFRALQKCEKILTGDKLNEMDALVGCTLFMPEPAQIAV